MAKHLPLRFRSPSSGRELALQALYKTDQAGAYSTLALSSLINKSTLDQRELKQATAMFYGTLSRQVGLDSCLQKFSKQPIADLDPLVRNALRLAAFQIYFSPQVPPQAAVNTAVELVKKHSHRGLSGYANAVLRALLRQLPAYPSTGAEAAAVHPALFEQINHCLAAEPLKADTAGLAAYWQAVNQEAPLYLRLRAGINAVDENLLIESLEGEGVTVKRLDWPKKTISLALGERSLTDLQAWQEGFLIAQGRAAQLPAIIAAYHQPRKVLDLCAAPGGKSLQLHDLLAPAVEITANDLHASRVQKIRENMVRLGIHDIKTQCRDATAALPEQEHGTYELVLADVPCSSLGLLQRKPELRLNQEHWDAALLETQAAILDHAAQALKPEGILIYSTCTLNPLENQEQIAAFLGRQKDAFTLTDLKSLPKALSEIPFTKKQLRESPGLLNLYPHIHGSEGFFIAQLRKKA